MSVLPWREAFIVAMGAFVLSAAGLALVWTMYRAERAENAVYEARVEMARATANANAEVVQRVASELQTCRDSLGPIVQANANAASQLNQASIRMQRALRTMDEERRKLYESTECAALANMPVCPAIGDRLRALQADHQN